MARKRIAIVGGGIAGVTAAWSLAAHPELFEILLFELSNRLGGIVETVHEQGFTIECGPDGWVTEKPWARQLAEELGLAGEIIPSNDATRKTYILREGSLVAMPDGMRMMVPSDLGTVDTSPLFSARAKRAFHEELLRTAELMASAPHEDESVASFVERHFGSEVLETVGAPLLSGVFGGDVATLSVRSVMAPFVAMERQYGSLIAAMQVRARTSAAPVFTTLRSGLGTLIDTMVSNIPRESIRLNTPVTGLSRTPTGWTVQTSSGGDFFDKVLLATPADIASRLLRSTDQRAADLMQMEASSAVVVAFGFEEHFELPQGFGFLVPHHPSEADPLLAATFVDQKFADRVPSNQRLLRAFFGGEVGARLLHAPDHEVIALALLQLRSILGDLPAPIITVLRRWPRSLPQYSVGHLERMTELGSRVETIRDLWLLGNGYRGVGLPDLIRDARSAAAELLAESAEA